MRIVLAFLIAPLVPAAVAMLLALAPSITGLLNPNPFLFMSLFYCYPIIVIIGIPTYWVFRRKGWLNLWPIVSAGIVAGAVTPLGIMYLLMGSKGFESLTNSPELLLYGISIGGFVAFSFWVIAFALPTSSDVKSGNHKDAA